MNAYTLFGLDPLGVEAMILCALAALGLVGFIAAGFALLWRAKRSASRLSRLAEHSPRELGLLALWRLERTLRGSSVQPTVVAPDQGGPVHPPQ